ncbi:MAG: hypothetical protein ACYC64_20205 [Armatimonadota bacterium]
MNSNKRTGIYAIGTTVCAIVLRYVDYPDSIMGMPCGGRFGRHG